MKKKLVLKIIGLCFLAFLVFFVSNGIYENIYLDQEIKSFMKKGVYEREEYIGSNKFVYYKVSRETYVSNGWEAFDRPTIQSTYIGYTGDILLNKRSPFEDMPLICEFISFFFGGHAASPIGTESDDGIYDGYSTEVLEVAGNTANQNYVRMIPNDWLTALRRRETIGVRVKGVTEAECYQYADNLFSMLGEPYNYTFIFNTNKSHYCTDLLNKGWSMVEKKYSVNDWFYTSVNDIVLSEHTYINFYKCQKDQVTYIYYLE